MSTTELSERLRAYLQHKGYCEIDQTDTCTCGLDRALEAQVQGSSGQEGEGHGSLGAPVAGPTVPLSAVSPPTRTDPPVAEDAAAISGAPAHRADMQTRRFLTRYPVGEAFFASHVFARDFAHAEQIIAIRNIGEIVEGVTDRQDAPPFPIDHIARAHTACFLSWVAARSGLADATEAIADDGIVHDAIHLFYGNYEQSIEHFDDRVVRLMHLVPGHLPAYTAPDSSEGAQPIAVESPEAAVRGLTEREINHIQKFSLDFCDKYATTFSSHDRVAIIIHLREAIAKFIGDHGYLSQQGRPDLPSGEAGVRTSVAQVNNKWHAIVSVGHQSFYLHALDGTEEEANEFARIVRDAFSALYRVDAKRIVKEVMDVYDWCMSKGMPMTREYFYANVHDMAARLLSGPSGSGEEKPVK